MGTTQKSDGRYIVGKGISNANEYKGSMGYRDIVIQLTADGATAESVQKLNYLKDYALYHSEKGEPIIPPNTQIWISGNGFSKAIEADDINISEDGISIGGIVYADDAWDYSHAGEGGGGGGGDSEIFVAVVRPNPDWAEESDPYWVCDSSFDEIVSAGEAGKIIHIAVNDYSAEDNPVAGNLYTTEVRYNDATEFEPAHFYGACRYFPDPSELYQNFPNYIAAVVPVAIFSNDSVYVGEEWINEVNPIPFVRDIEVIYALDGNNVSCNTYLEYLMEMANIGYPIRARLFDGQKYTECNTIDVDQGNNTITAVFTEFECLSATNELFVYETKIVHTSVSDEDSITRTFYTGNIPFPGGSNSE